PCHAARKDDSQTPSTVRQEGVLPTQGDGGAGLRANQGGSGPAEVSVPWLGGCPSRVEPDLCHPQPVEAVPERVDPPNGISKAVLQSRSAPPTPSQTPLDARSPDLCGSRSKSTVSPRGLEACPLGEISCAASGKPTGSYAHNWHH